MPINRNILTLEEFRKQEVRSLPNATGELSNLLRDIALAAKRVNAEVNKAGLVDILGETGNSNIHGEEVQQLDSFANLQFMAVLQRGISCAGIASEEMEDFEAFDEQLSNQSKYVCVFDPLDGSSNIDVNVSIGTIFSIYRRISEPGYPCVLGDFLQPGHQQVAAGYIIYGSSTMLVYATRRGVNGFTLDPGMGEFTLSHPNIHCPKSGKYYSVNHGSYFRFDKRVRNYIINCQQKTKEAGGPYTQRYVGSMVADMHRNLIKGGIFLYPATFDRPDGKLRLVYECNPFAFILEVAGGKATNGEQRILDIQPKSLHQRSSVYIGSANMMDELEEFLNAKTIVNENPYH
ncbi:MAG: class 1 fructose-bisphosphatase [Chitinophagaceae bacterium]